MIDLDHFERTADRIFAWRGFGRFDDIFFAASLTPDANIDGFDPSADCPAIREIDALFGASLVYVANQVIQSRSSWPEIDLADCPFDDRLCFPRKNPAPCPSAHSLWLERFDSAG